MSQNKQLLSTILYFHNYNFLIDILKLDPMSILLRLK